MGSLFTIFYSHTAQTVLLPTLLPRWAMACWASTLWSMFYSVMVPLAT